MPSLPSVRRRAELSRRTALGGVAALGAAVLVTGCTSGGDEPRPRSGGGVTRSPGTDPDVALAATVLAEEQGLLDLVLATVRRHPGLAGALGGARTAHQAHVALLADAVPEGSRPSPSGSPTTGAPTPVPRRAPVALAAVARREDELTQVARSSALAARSGAFARVLASMAAASAQQAESLSTTGRAPS